MNDPDVYDYHLKIGEADPIPWYFSYFQIADRCNCSPWDLIDEPTPRDFWVQAAYIVMQAENEHARYMKEHGKDGETRDNQSRLPGTIG